MFLALPIPDYLFQDKIKPYSEQDFFFVIHFQKVNQKDTEMQLLQRSHKKDNWSKL